VNKLWELIWELDIVGMNIGLAPSAGRGCGMEDVKTQIVIIIGSHWMKKRRMRNERVAEKISGSFGIA